MTIRVLRPTATSTLPRTDGAYDNSIPMSLTGGPLALSDDDDNTYAAATDETDGVGIRGNGQGAVYPVLARFAATGVNFQGFKVRLRALVYQKGTSMPPDGPPPPGAFFGAIVNEDVTASVGDQGSFYITLEQTELPEWFESDWNTSMNGIEVTAGPLRVYIDYQSSLNLDVPNGPLIDVYELELVVEDYVAPVYDGDTIRRNLVINPSGEQNFNRAWVGSNGSVTTAYSWEVS